MTKDDYVQTLPYLIISFCILAYALHAPEGLLNLVIGGCLGVITPKAPSSTQP
jgi:hypothetical protein